MPVNRTIIWSDVAPEHRQAVYSTLRLTAQGLRALKPGPLGPMRSKSDEAYADAHDALANLLRAIDPTIRPVILTELAR